MPLRRARKLIAFVLLSSAAYAQKPAPAPPQLSPKAAYDEAMHPLEVTRHYIANWSDIEIDALKTAVLQAATACAARDPITFSGDTLVDLARLCTLGQSWPSVLKASTLYIEADTPSKPLLTQAYVSQIDALLHLKDEPSALASAKAMLAATPYDILVAEATNTTIAYMQFANTADALTLATLRQPLLLAQLRAPRPATTDATKPTQTIHDLYADGIAFAALQQLANQLEAARATLTQLDAALPANLTPDDTLPIAAARTRYAFLGHPLPAITMLDSLAMPNKLPELPAPHAITALLLFPDTCAHCVRMGRLFPTSVFLVTNHEAYLFGLMAETLPPQPKPLPAKDAPPPKPTPRDLLVETPTVVVPPSVLSQFAATDFPFLILADAQGIIRVLQPVDEDALQPGSTIDTAIANIAATWPLPKPPAPATPQPPN